MYDLWKIVITNKTLLGDQNTNILRFQISHEVHLNKNYYG